MALNYRGKYLPVYHMTSFFYIQMTFVWGFVGLVRYYIDWESRPLFNGRSHLVNINDAIASCVFDILEDMQEGTYLHGYIK